MKDPSGSDDSPRGESHRWGEGGIEHTVVRYYWFISYLHNVRPRPTVSLLLTPQTGMSKGRQS